jgi:transketolase
LVSTYFFEQIRTVIGHGSQKAGTDKVHGAPLGANDIEYVKKQFGYDPTQVSYVSVTGKSDISSFHDVVLTNPSHSYTVP